MQALKYISFFLMLFPLITKGQTFTNTSTVAIPASNTTLSYFSNAINVTGLPNIDGAPFGLEQVEITFNTANFTNMELFLVSPNGRIVELINIRNGSGNVTGTYTLNMNPSNIKLRDTVATSPPPPFPLIPMASLNSVNDGSSPNGVWRLLGRLSLFISFSTNQITNWKLTFGNTNTRPTASNDDCTGAISLINTAQTGLFVSGTNNEYGAKIPSTGDVTGSSVCSSSGYTENSAWFTWIASCANDSVNIQSFTRVQTGVVKGNCSGPFTNIACKVVDNPNNYTYKFTNLIPGTRYYLIMDGDNAYSGPFDIRWYPGSCAPLPVTLLNLHSSYEDESEQIKIQWQTAYEKDNKEFILKVRYFGQSSDFIEIARIKSAYSNNGGVYNFSWKPFQDGLYQFQLYQTDIDGTTSYLGQTFSNVNFSIANFTTLIYTESGPQLNVELDTPDLLEISLIDLSGKTVWSDLKQANAGFSTYQLPSNFSQSLYLLEVRKSDSIERRKILYK